MSEAAALTRLRDAVEQQLDDDEEQLGLFSEPVTEAGKAKMVAYRRGPGRPPGARNKRTEATVAHLLQRYRDPRAVAMERIQMHPADLAAILGCTVYEASQEQRLYIAIVAPYLHARITPEVIDNRQVIHLHLGTTSEAGEAAAGGPVRVLDPAEYHTVSVEPTEDRGEQ